MDKPDWSVAPPECDWLAQDEDGHWWFFRLKPRLGRAEWLGRAALPLDYKSGVPLVPNSLWRDTLEQRPRAIGDKNRALLERRDDK